MFGTVLVANRGEIAVRVIRTLRALGIGSVAVYSDADARARHVRAADVAVRLGPAPAADSYLNAGAIVAAARQTGAQAVHPGYGFLAENAAFARACADAGLTFIGPPPAAIEAMGDKIRAKATVAAAGVPVVPGAGDPSMTERDLVTAAPAVGFPLLIKPSAGGGGKGMRLVRAESELAGAIAGARREATAAFGDGTLLLERFIDRPRHIEIQVFADTHGHTVHLGERECSLQRRHQKIIEEAPSPLLDGARRDAMGGAATEVARSVGYVGAGTVEFIVSGDRPGDFYFMEMNTRLQVEHPVTEMVTGLDLVEWQLRVAAGEALPLRQEEIRLTGHAVEARVYAEDPARGFLPTGGTVLALAEPAGPHVRTDSGLTAGLDVTSSYDPMLAKVIAWAPDRDAALRRPPGGAGGHHRPRRDHQRRVPGRIAHPAGRGRGPPGHRPGRTAPGRPRGHGRAGRGPGGRRAGEPAGPPAARPGDGSLGHPGRVASRGARVDPAAAGVRPARGDRGPDPGASRWCPVGLQGPVGPVGLQGPVGPVGLQGAGSGVRRGRRAWPGSGERRGVGGRGRAGTGLGRSRPRRPAGQLRRPDVPVRAAPGRTVCPVAGRPAAGVPAAAGPAAGGPAGRCSGWAARGTAGR